MNKAIFYRLFLILTGLQGGYALYSLLSIQRDPKKALLFGLSYERILLTSIPLTIIAISGFLLAKTWWDKDWEGRFDNKIRVQLDRHHRLSIAFFICGLLSVIGGIYTSVVTHRSFYVLAPPEHGLFSYMVYYVNQIYSATSPYLIRLQPLTILLTGICIQTIMVLILMMFESRGWEQKFKTQYIYIIFATYGMLLILWKILGWTQLKLVPDNTSSRWLTLGSPILETQVLLAFVIGCGVLAIGILIDNFRRRRSQTNIKKRFVFKIDQVLVLTIWLVAAAYWISFPTQDSKFFNKPRYPNYAYYPNSDAFTYDTTAQNLLVGAGIKTRDLEYPRRPVHALYLALLYGVIGQNYDAVTRVQSVLLGVFPALVYLVTARLHTRLSGLIAATLVILREGNGIFLANYITDSNTRLIMPEMPAAVGIALLVLMAGLWMQRPQRQTEYSLLMGGIAAFFMLVRIEVEVFLIVFVLFIGMKLFWHPKKWLVNVSLVALGAVLFLAPWIWRNWRVTGRIYIEQPGERTTYFLDNAGFSNSSTSPKHTTDLAPQTNDGIAHNFIQQSLSHLFNSQAQSILMFPDAYRAIDSAIGFFGHRSWSGFLKVCCSRQDYISRLYPLWHEWNGSIQIQSVFPIMVTLFIMSVGFIYGGKIPGGFGGFPFLLVFTHYLISSFVRVSGGRFIQIVDWIWIVYYSIGLGQLALWTFSSLISSKSPSQLGNPNESDSILLIESMPRQLPRTAYVKISLLILLIGTLLPLTEFIIKPRYTLQTKQLWLEEIKQSRTLLSDYPQLKNYIEEINPTDPSVLQGRALYPRYYPMGESSLEYESWNAPREYDRFSFYLVGPINTGVVVPLGEKPVLSFPQASDVLIIGCQDKDFFKGFIVYVKSTNNVLISSPLPDTFSCPERRTTYVK